MSDVRILLQRARRLTMADCATLVESLAVAVWIEMALRLTSCSRVQLWLGRVRRFNAAGPARGTPAVGELYSRLTRFTAAAYRILPLPMTCLRESLVLCVLLNRRGARARLCFGVRMEGSTLAAHAWVECEGVANERRRSTFRELRALTG